MSHELRTPINVVGGISEIMLKSDPAPEDEENLTAIFKAGQRMRRQVSDILNFSELQTGHFKLSEGEYEPASLVQDVVSSALSADPTSLDFVVDFAPDIPKTLHGDEKSLKKVLFCLFDNAVKFTTQGGGCFSVAARKETYGVNFNVDVVDTGAGLSTGENDRLFHGVYAAETGSRRSRGGLGLGLTIALGLTEAMHGFLTVESGSDGTHIHVSVPQRVGEETHSISLKNPEDFHVLFWLSPEHLSAPKVQGFYKALTEHLKRGLSLDVRIVSSIEEVRAGKSQMTHLFLTDAEYREAPEDVASLSREKTVCLWAPEKKDFSFAPDVCLFPWPVSTLSVVTALEQTRERPAAKAPAAATETQAENGTEPDSKPAAGEQKLAEHPGKEPVAELQEALPAGKTALVVDYEKMNLMVARGILKKCGVTAETALSGPEAVEKCREKKYDIIFMDYMMPEMNGTEAMLEIRTLQDGYYETCPIVILTANAVSGAKEQFLRDGFDEFLSKPVNIKAMEKTLHHQLTGGAA